MTPRPLERVYRVGGARHEASVRLEGDRIVGTLDGAPVDAEVRRDGEGDLLISFGGTSARAVVARKGPILLVNVDGQTHEFATADPAVAEAAAPPAEPFAVSPTAGLLVKVPVAAGAAVKKGGVLFVVEAMKMEYVATADRDVVVAEVKRRSGERVDLGEIVVTFRERPAS